AARRLPDSLPKKTKSPARGRGIFGFKRASPPRYFAGQLRPGGGARDLRPTGLRRRRRQARRIRTRPPPRPRGRALAPRRSERGTDRSRARADRPRRAHAGKEQPVRGDGIAGRNAGGIVAAGKYPPASCRRGREGRVVGAAGKDGRTMQSIDTTATATGVLTARRTTLAEAIEAARAYASGEADSVPPCIGRALVAFALETASDLARGSEVSLATAIAAHVYGTG